VRGQELQPTGEHARIADPTRRESLVVVVDFATMIDREAHAPEKVIIS